jgi:hypothetical protein
MREDECTAPRTKYAKDKKTQRTQRKTKIQMKKRKAKCKRHWTQMNADFRRIYELRFRN